MELLKYSDFHINDQWERTSDLKQYKGKAEVYTLHSLHPISVKQGKKYMECLDVYVSDIEYSSFKLY